MKLPKDGDNIQLTIDANIQSHAEEVLATLVTGYRGEGGTVIVADPKTGKILAMASYPTFDPNTYGEFEIGSFLNPSVQSVYEPGSIFKVITMASAIDAGKITPSEFIKKIEARKKVELLDSSQMEVIIEKVIADNIKAVSSLL